MFNDYSWIDDRSEEQSKRYATFLSSVKPGDNLVVIELGAGTAVSTVRNTSEQVSNEKKGTLVRINPDDPDVDRGIKWGWARYEHNTEKGIGIPLGALKALEEIHKELNQVNK